MNNSPIETSQTTAFTRKTKQSAGSRFVQNKRKLLCWLSLKFVKNPNYHGISFINACHLHLEKHFAYTSVLRESSLICFKSSKLGTNCFGCRWPRRCSPPSWRPPWISLGCGTCTCCAHSSTSVTVWAWSTVSWTTNSWVGTTGPTRSRKLWRSGSRCTPRSPSTSTSRTLPLLFQNTHQRLSTTLKQQ